MKIKISDLLDDWEDGAVELPPPPEIDPEQIRARTRQRLRTRPRGRRGISRLLLCAVLAGALCISAAAYLLGPGEMLNSFFTLESGALSDAQKETLDGMGTAELPASSDGGVTLTPLAAVMDEHTLYLRLRVEAPEGTALPDMGEQEDYAFLDFDLRDTDTDERDGACMQKARWLPDDVPGDNVTELVFILYGDASLNLNDGRERTLYLRDMLFHPNGAEDFVLLEGEWTFPLSAVDQSQEVTVDTTDATRWNEEAQVTMRLDELRISPLSVLYRISCPYETPAQGTYLEAGIEVVLTDGSVITINVGQGTFDSRYAEAVYAFDSPVPLEQIDFIRFGECELTLPEASP